VFFALCPEPAIRQSLQQQMLGLERIARPVAVEKLHLTLLFLGSLVESQLECVCAVVQSMRQARFALCLDRVLVKKRQGMLWLSPSVIPPALVELEQQLRLRLAACDLNLEMRGFKPHLTLVRKLRLFSHIPEINLPLWAVESFVLLESVVQTGGNRYQQVQKWCLY
jgi:2'-5' RNA ligase